MPRFQADIHLPSARLFGPAALAAVYYRFSPLHHLKSNLI
jgi:hypothetical protein